jgi:hypothetical protein
MSDHVITNIRLAIRYGLSLIISGNDAGDGYLYRRTITHIAKPVEDPEQFPSLDAAVIMMGDDYNNDNTRDGTANKSILENHLDITIVNFMHDINDIELAQENKLADLQKYFALNYWLPSSSGTRTAFNCIYSGSRPFGYSATQPNCGLEYKMRVWYRQKFEDPTTLA